MNRVKNSRSTFAIKKILIFKLDMFVVKKKNNIYSKNIVFNIKSNDRKNQVRILKQCF